MVKFIINKELDIEILNEFLNISAGGINFSESIYNYHPTLKQIPLDDQFSLRNYLEKFYGENEKELKNKVIVFQNQWDKIETDFIKACIKLFNGYSFPKGKYVGYVSSLPCNPRFLENKTFQIFYKSPTSLEITSHELLHFIFYSYTSVKLNNLVESLDTNSGIWWDAAEIFNNVVLSSEIFSSLLGKSCESPYPDHVKYLDKAKRLFIDRKNIDDFIISLFDTLKKE